jgi:hypothetical protein
MGGPSAQQQQLASEQAQFYQTMTQDYSQTFAQNQQVLGQLQQAWDPVLKAGINQYGYSPQENQALQSLATNTTGADYQNAAKAVNEQIAARGGGNAVLPSGTSEQIQAQVASQAAELQSQQQLNITQQGYAQGTQNYLAAANALGSVASAYNPTGYSSSANQSGSSAYQSAAENQQMSNAWIGMVAGSLGGMASAAIGNPGLVHT